MPTEIEQEYKFMVLDTGQVIYIKAMSYADAWCKVSLKVNAQQASSLRAIPVTPKGT